MNQSTCSNPSTSRTEFVRPAVEISETPEAYLLHAEMPGVPKDGVEVTVKDGTLTVVGHRTSPQRSNTRVLHRETSQADYRRSFDLGPTVDASKIDAKLNEGVLTLVLPKAEAVKPRKITIA